MDASKVADNWPPSTGVAKVQVGAMIIGAQDLCCFVTQLEVDDGNWVGDFVGGRSNGRGVLTKRPQADQEAAAMQY